MLVQHEVMAKQLVPRSGTSAQRNSAGVKAELVQQSTVDIASKQTSDMMPYMCVFLGVVTWVRSRTADLQRDLLADTTRALESTTGASKRPLRMILRG